MGQSCSVLNRHQVESNVLLRDFFGKETIGINEPFWNQFLSFKSEGLIVRPVHKSLYLLLEQKYGTQIAENYCSGNIVNLIAVFIQYSKEIIAIYQSGDSVQGNGDILIKQAGNALLILRFIVQSMAATNTGDTGRLLLLEVECLPQHFATDETDSISVFDEFLQHLMSILLNVPVSDVSLELHLEIVLMYFTLLSSHVFGDADISVEDGSSSCKKPSFLSLISLHSADLSKYLLSNILSRYETPHSIVYNTLAIVDDRPTSLMVASIDWLKTFFGSGDNKTDDNDDDGTGDASKCQTTKTDLSFALANHSLLLCILLSCSDFSYLLSSSSDIGNPFLNVLTSFTDSEIQIASNPSTQTSDSSPPPFSLSMSSICVALSDSLSDGAGLRKRPALVFLYLLLHRNSSFKACALSRSDIDRLVVPLLRILYSYTSFTEAAANAASSGEKQVKESESDQLAFSAWHRDHAYLALICLLIFTEDDAFCRFANDLSLSSKSLSMFYAEHGDAAALGNYPTLASLALLVLLRAIRRNLLVGRDHYLHTSCLAALANLAAHTTEMHIAVASRLVDLLVALARRRMRLCSLLRSAEASSIEETEGALSATDDTARLLLEAVNAALSARGRGPACNAHLVVSLLREQDTLVSAFRSVPNFQDLLLNIQFIAEYFSTHLEREISPSPKAKSGHQKSPETSGQNVTLTSVNEVLKVVKSAGSHFPTTRLRKMPDLKFHYVEESSASSHFFLPYAMALYQRFGFIYWPPVVSDEKGIAPEIQTMPGEQTV